MTSHMGIRLVHRDDRELVIRADLQPNLNIHGTAFGGSLFSICAVTCWGLLHMKFEDAGLAADSVLGDASISYSRPVKGVIEASCRVPEDDSFDAFIGQLKRGRRAALELTAEIRDRDRLAVRYRGSYSAHIRPQ